MFKCLFQAHIARPLMSTWYSQGAALPWPTKIVGRGRSMGYLLDFGKNPWSSLAKKLVRHENLATNSRALNAILTPVPYSIPEMHDACVHVKVKK
jgi:hypothetical protein